MKRSTFFAVLALISGGMAITPATAATWVMWDGSTPQYVTFVETPTPILKELSAPVLVEDQAFTGAKVLERDITIHRWQMRNEKLNYEAVEALKNAKFEKN
jgi:hypothetical protein